MIAGKVYGTATEDMDALTFGSNVLLRYLTASEARKLPVKEFSYDKVLKGFELNRDEFIDLCILMGCDYCETIRGIGPKRAVELINTYRNIETIIDNIDTKKYTVPENWNYQIARKLFISPDVTDPNEVELKWTDPDEDGLVKFLCGDRQFSEERIRNGVKKIIKSKSTSTQARLDGFFKVLPSTATPKRKLDEDKKSASAKKQKLGGKSGFKGKKPK